MKMGFAHRFAFASNRRVRGVTLVMVTGVLAILSAIGAGYYTLTYGATRTATRFSDSTAAEICVHAGLADAIARLRQ